MTDADWGQFVAGDHNPSDSEQTAGQAVEAMPGETVQPQTDPADLTDDATAQGQSDDGIDESNAQAQPTDPQDGAAVAPDLATANAAATGQTDGTATDGTHPAGAGDEAAGVPSGGAETGSSDTPTDVPTDAAETWEDWGQGSLATAAVMEEVAAEHLQAASEWAAYGNIEAAREELVEAHIASELGAESAIIAETEFEIAAEYREHESGSDESQAAAGVDEAASIDTGQSDGDTDDGSADSDQDRD